MIITRILATIPFIALILIYLGVVRLKGRIRIAAIAVAVLGVTIWLPLRHHYFLSTWSSERPFRASVGKTVYHGLGYWGWFDVDSLKDLFLLDAGLSRALREHEDPRIRYHSAIVLGLRSRIRDQETLRNAMNDTNFYVRLAAAIAVWRHNSPNVTYTDITHCVAETSLAEYMGVAELPSVPYGDEHKDIWERFITEVKKDFGSGVP